MDHALLRSLGYSIFFAISPLIIAGPLSPVSHAMQPDGYEDQIIVTADGQERSQSDVPAAIALITGEEIDNLHSIRIGEVLANAPGTFFAGLNGPREIALIRQPLAFDNRTLFLEDGVPLQSSIFFDQSALGYSFALSAADAIEVLRGPGTALYGSDAFSGVINIRSRAINDQTEGYARARYGQFGLFDIAGTINTPLTDQQGLRLTVSHSGEDGFRDETAFTRTQGVIQHQYSSERIEVHSLATYTHYETEPATAIPFADFLAGSRASGLSPLIDPGSADEIGDYFRLQSKISVDATSTLTVDIIPYWRRQDISATATFQPATVPRTDALVDTQGLITRGYWTHNDHAQTLFGLDIELTDFDRFTNQQAPDTIVFGSLFRQGVQFDYTVNYRGLSPYIQHDHKIGPLTIQAGLRYDNLRYDFDNALVEVPGDARFQVEDRIDRFEALSPKAAIIFDVTPSHSVFARYARGFRIPREGDLYELEEGQEEFTLEPETIDSGEIGWRYATSRLRTELVGYWAVSRDGIITDVQTAAGNISINAGSSRFRGVEASATARLSDAITLDLALAFQDFRFRRRAADGPDPFDGNLISESPRTLGTLTLNWTPGQWDRFEGSARLRHIGRWALNDANTQFTDDEFILSLFGRYQLTDYLQAEIRLENVTDTLYPVFADAPVFAPNGRARPASPRTISGGINLRF